MAKAKKEIKDEVKDVAHPGSRAASVIIEEQEHGIKIVPNKPRIIGGLCEFCGIKAEDCPHAS